jgi:hypothetical protein
MSKEMKDFLSQFMNQPEPKAVEIAAIKPTEKAEKNEEKPKPVKTTLTKVEKIPLKSVKKAPEVSHTEGGGESKTKIKTPKSFVASDSEATVGVIEFVSTEAFLQSINEKKYSFEKKKNLQIDDQLFNILNLVKQHEDIKSIATLLNAIIEKYISDNKTNLKQILSKNPLGNG